MSMLLKREIDRAIQKNDIESVLCHTVLVSHEVISADSTLADSESYYETEIKDCSNCKFFNVCSACIINE